MIKQYYDEYLKRQYIEDLKGGPNPKKKSQPAQKSLFANMDNKEKFKLIIKQKVIENEQEIAA